MTTEESTEDTSTDTGTEDGKSESLATQESSEETTSESLATKGSTEGNEADGDSDDSGKGDGKGGEDGSSEEGTPESYTDFNLPDGMELDGERLESASELFKGLDLSQEQAQSLVDYFTSDQAKLAEGTEARQQEEADTLRNETLNDPVIGGTHREQAQAMTGRALYGFDPSGEFATYLNTPIDGKLPGDNPHINRFLVAVGSAMAEDSGGSRGNADAERNFLDDMYPTMVAD